MWGYSLLDQESFIKELGLEREVGRRMLRRTSPARADETVLKRGAAAAGIPESFALLGAQAVVADEPALPERIEALEAQQTALRRRANDDAAALAGVQRQLDVVLSRLASDLPREFAQELLEAVQQARQRGEDTERVARDQQREDRAS